MKTKRQPPKRVYVVLCKDRQMVEAYLTKSLAKRGAANWLIIDPHYGPFTVQLYILPTKRKAKRGKSK